MLSKRITGTLIMLAIATLIIPVSAFTFSAGDATVNGIGSTATVNLVLDEAPTGLAGFNVTVSLADPGVAEIMSVSYPAWVSQYDNSSLPADTVWIKTVDMGAGENGTIAPGAVNIPMGTLTLRGDAAGTTAVTVTINQMSDDLGSNMFPSIVPGSFTVNIPPVAQFDANQTSGNAPLTVLFTDQSTGSPTSWSWTFGDGGTSTEQDPVYTYTSAGTYTVTLTATNAGGSDSEVKIGFISVNALPVAPVVNFIGDPRSGPAPLVVNFTDQSTGTPTSWAWDFENDGVVDSTEQNPTHTYTTPGTYQVNLTASNTGGSANRLKGNYIQVTAIGNVNPVVDFSADSRSGTAPLTVHFTDLTVTNPIAWAWDFENDGVVDSALQNPSHTYTVPGTYQVYLNVTNSSGTAGRLKANFITVTEASAQAPVAAFTASPTSGTAPLTVTFTDQSTGSPTAWSWNFGDGSTSTVQNPVHLYSSIGTYTATLTATNGEGSDTEVKTDYIRVYTAGTTALIVTPQSIAMPVGSVQTYMFTVNRVTTGLAGSNLTVGLSDPSVGEITGVTLPAWAVLNDTSALPADTLWFGGVDLGQQIQDEAVNIPLGAITVRADTVGTTTLLVTAPELDNETGYPIPIVVSNAELTAYQPVAADFTADVTTGTIPLAVSFTSRSTGDPAPTSCAWNFGDGSTSTAWNPTHEYTLPGRYTVSLTVTGPYNQDTVTGYIVATRTVEPFPGQTLSPLDPDFDGRYEDINGNGILDFEDVVIFYKNMEWVRTNTAVGIAPYDYNGNGLIDYDDVVQLFLEVAHS
jgi:PKD repeat protein